MYDSREFTINFDNLTNIFNRRLSEDVRNNLNKILTSTNFNNSDKRFILFIINIYEDNTKDNIYLNNFLEFILDEQISNKISLSLSVFLYSISQKITASRIISSINTEEVKNKKYKFNLDLEEETISEIELLKIKINTITSVANNILELDNKVFYSILNKILNSNVPVQNYTFIEELFKNEVLKSDSNKREAILSFVLRKEITDLKKETNVRDEIKDLSVWNVLTYEDILGMPIDIYKRIVKISLTLDKLQLYIFDFIMRHKDLKLDRKIMLLDYLEYMLVNFKNQYYKSNVIGVMESNLINVFNIVYSKIFMMMDDDEFFRQLKVLMATNNPVAYVKVLVNQDLDDEKKEFALNLINGGKSLIRTDKEKIEKSKVKDYKDYVAMAAISPVLVNLPMNEYISILSMINKCCDELECLYREREQDKTKLIDKRIENGHIIKGVVMLLNHPELYLDNMSRFYMTVDMLFEISEYCINNIVAFACSPESVCYNDSEYISILKLIRYSYKGERLYDFFYNSMGACYIDLGYVKDQRFQRKENAQVIVNLFTNDNVWFMEDKSTLFDIAENKDLDYIRMITKELNDLRDYNRNIASVLEGVDDNVVRIIGPALVKLKNNN